LLNTCFATSVEELPFVPQRIITAKSSASDRDVELSADGPLREPYAVYFQGGLTWYHAKLGILMSLQKLYEQKLVNEDMMC